MLGVSPRDNLFRNNGNGGLKLTEEALSFVEKGGGMEGRGSRELASYKLPVEGRGSRELASYKLPSTPQKQQVVIMSAESIEMGVKKVKSTKPMTKHKTLPWGGKQTSNGKDKDPHTPKTPLRAIDSEINMTWADNRVPALTIGTIACQSTWIPCSTVAASHLCMPAEREEGDLSPTGKSTWDQLAHLRDLLKSGSKLKRVVHSIYKEVAPNQDALDEFDYRDFRSTVSESLNLPSDFFGDADDEFLRFDLDGSDSLQERECYRLMKFLMREYVRSVGHSMYDIEIKECTLKDAGHTILENKIGQGSFAMMRRTEGPDGTQCCVKCFPKSTTTGATIRNLKDEYEMMHVLRHANIAKTREVFEDSEFFYIVNELYTGGDFSTLIERVDKMGIVKTEVWWQNLFRQCFLGLQYLHVRAIMHCDLKEANIMVRNQNLKEPEVVIIDYGLAQTYGRDRQKLCGTPGYIPPETWDCYKWYPKGDCFSMGVTMIQMMTDNTPITELPEPGQPLSQAKTIKAGIFTEGAKTLQQVAEFTSNKQPPYDLIPDELEAVIPLLVQLLETDMGGRFTSYQALEDTSITWLQMEDVSSSEDDLDARMAEARTTASRASHSASDVSSGNALNLSPHSSPNFKKLMSRVKSTAPILHSDSDRSDSDSDEPDSHGTDSRGEDASPANDMPRGSRLTKPRVSFSLGTAEPRPGRFTSSVAHFSTERRDSLPNPSPCGLAVKALESLLAPPKAPQEPVQPPTTDDLDATVVTASTSDKQALETPEQEVEGGSANSLTGKTSPSVRRWQTCPGVNTSPSGTSDLSTTVVSALSVDASMELSNSNTSQLAQVLRQQELAGQRFRRDRLGARHLGKTLSPRESTTNPQQQSSPSLPTRSLQVRFVPAPAGAAAAGVQQFASGYPSGASTHRAYANPLQARPLTQVSLNAPPPPTTDSANTGAGRFIYVPPASQSTPASGVYPKGVLGSEGSCASHASVRTATSPLPSQCDSARTPVPKVVMPSARDTPKTVHFAPQIRQGTSLSPSQAYRPIRSSTALPGAPSLQSALRPRQDGLMSPRVPAGEAYPRQMQSQSVLATAGSRTPATPGPIAPSAPLRHAQAPASRGRVAGVASVHPAGGRGPQAAAAAPPPRSPSWSGQRLRSPSVSAPNPLSALPPSQLSPSSTAPRPLASTTGAAPVWPVLLRHSTAPGITSIGAPFPSNQIEGSVLGQWSQSATLSRAALQ